MIHRRGGHMSYFMKRSRNVNNRKKVFLQQQLRQAVFISKKTSLKSLRFTIWRRCVDSGFSVDFFCSFRGSKKNKEDFFVIYGIKKCLDSIFVTSLGDFLRFSFNFQTQIEKRKAYKLISKSLLFFDKTNLTSVFF